MEAENTFEMTGRKLLNIGTLSIWMENGEPHHRGLPLEEAQTRVRGWIAEAQAWLDAVDDREAAIKAERLTPDEEKAVNRQMQKERARFKKQGISPEKAREIIAKRIRLCRGDDYSDL